MPDASGDNVSKGSFRFRFRLNLSLNPGIFKYWTEKDNTIKMNQKNVTKSVNNSNINYKIVFIKYLYTTELHCRHKIFESNIKHF